MALPIRQGRSALHSPAPRSAPAAQRPPSDPRPAPPRQRAHPRPARPAAPLAGSRRVPERHGAGGPTGPRQLARGALARRPLRSPAGSLGRVEPAVQAVARGTWSRRAGGGGGGAGGGRSARARQSGARSSLVGSPEPGARGSGALGPASARGHMAPFRTLLSCLLPLHWALCAAAGSRTPGACRSGARGRMGSGVPGSQAGPRGPEGPAAFRGAGGGARPGLELFLPLWPGR